MSTAKHYLNKAAGMFGSSVTGDSSDSVSDSSIPDSEGFPPSVMTSSATALDMKSTSPVNSLYTDGDVARLDEGVTFPETGFDGYRKASYDISPFTAESNEVKHNLHTTSFVPLSSVT